MLDSELKIGTPVRVYWNFHKKLFSVQIQSTNSKGKKTWKVARHVKFLVLKDVKFVVNEAGRQRVLREKRKNVHAKIHGTVSFISEMKHFKGLVRYNPYITSKFLISQDGHTKHIENADVISLSSIMDGPRIAVMG